MSSGGADRFGRDDDSEPIYQDSSELDEWVRLAYGESREALERLGVPVSQITDEDVGQDEHLAHSILRSRSSQEFSRSPGNSAELGFNKKDYAALRRQSKQKNRELDRKLKKKMARWAIRASSTMLAVSSVAFGLYMVSQWRSIPQAAMIGWMSASLVEVLGIVYIVARYLFPNGKK